MFLWLKLEGELREVSVTKSKWEEIKKRGWLVLLNCRDIRISTEEKPLHIAIKSLVTFKSSFERMFAAKLHLVEAHEREKLAVQGSLGKNKQRRGRE